MGHLPDPDIFRDDPDAILRWKQYFPHYENEESLTVEDIPTLISIVANWINSPVWISEDPILRQACQHLGLLRDRP